MSLAQAMKAKGLSSGDLAELTGIPRSNLAAFKTGNRRMGATTAAKIAPHVGQTPGELVLGNKFASLKRARDEGDARGVLNAVKSIVGSVQKSAGDSADEDLDELVDWAVKFAEGHGGLFTDLPTDEDGRDPSGRRVEEFVSVYEDEADDEEEDPYGYAAEGRNSRGARREVR